MKKVAATLPEEAKCFEPAFLQEVTREIMSPIVGTL
jgi:hypothetical protein